MCVCVKMQGDICWLINRIDNLYQGCGYDTSSPLYILYKTYIIVLGCTMLTYKANCMCNTIISACDRGLLDVAS